MTETKFQVGKLGRMIGVMSPALRVDIFICVLKACGWIYRAFGYSLGMKFPCSLFIICFVFLL